MSLRFRKSFSLGKGVKINLSKSGLGMSVGGKGMRLGISPKKGNYTSLSIPKTGINYLNYNNSSKHHTSTDNTNILKGLGIVIIFILILSIPFLGILILLGASIYYYKKYNSLEERTNRLLKRGRYLFNQEKYDESIIFLNQGLELDKNNTDILYLIGACFLNNGDYKNSEKYFKDYNILNPGNDYVELLLAKSLYENKKHKEAVKILQEIPEYSENYLKAIQLLGGCFIEEENYEAAINTFKKAPLQKKKLDNELLELHYNLALTYEKIGDTRNALKHFNKVYANDITFREVIKKISDLK